jgi:5,10-methylenetetrahydromethanopterin reductase
MALAPLRFGITVMATEPPDSFRELVRLVEESGFDELWVCDSSLHARDVYAYLTLVATHTTRVRFGPNCTHPYTRHPGVTVNAMATLHELSGGRAVLAIGAGDRPVTELGHRTATVSVVREMIESARALLAGGTVDRGGAVVLRHAHLPVALPSPLPVYVSASGPKMLELAGELADGVLFLAGVYAPCVEFAVARIRAGAARVGRDPATLDLGCTLVGSLREDVALARQECVPLAAWFPQSAPVYAALAGVPEATIAAIRAAYAGGHFDGPREAFKHVTDEMIDRFTVAGPADLWVRRIEALIARGIRHVNVFLLSKDPHAMVRDLADKVLPQVR